jgi:hypothetical protein
MYAAYAGIFVLLAGSAVWWFRARRNRKVAKSSVRKHDSEETDIDKVGSPDACWYLFKLIHMHAQ